MSDYTKVTDFAAKDFLPRGDPDKVVSGQELDNEFAAIETAIASKAEASAVPGDNAVDTTVAATFTAGFGTAVDDASVSSGWTGDADASNVFEVTYTSSTVSVATPTNGKSGQRIYIKFINGVGACTFTWESGWRFRATENRQPTQTLAAVDIVLAVYDGSAWFATYMGKDYS